MTIPVCLLLQTPTPFPPGVFGPSPMEIAVAVTVIVGVIGVVGACLMLVRGWLRRWSTPPAAADDATARELRDAVQRLSAEVAELHERVDFTERVMAAQRPAERVDGGGGSHGAG